MYYYKFTSDTPYMGTEQEYYHSTSIPLTKDEIENMCDEYANDAYESFQYLLTGWNYENLEGLTEEEENEMLENFRADCECGCEEISEEEYLKNA